MARAETLGLITGAARDAGDALASIASLLPPRLSPNGPTRRMAYDVLAVWVRLLLRVRAIRRVA